MSKEVEKTYLIVGIDESNHISEYNNGRKEIVAATFSRDVNDGLYRAYSSQREDKRLELLREWMRQDGRDYRFVTLGDIRIRKFQPIASLVTIPLIKGYMGCLKASNREIPSDLRLFVDGILSREDRTYFERTLLEDFETVIVRNLIKRDKIAAKRRKGRDFLGPRAIEMADVLSYELYNGRDCDQTELSLAQLQNHQKRIIIEEESLVKQIEEELARRRAR